MTPCPSYRPPAPVYSATPRRVAPLAAVTGRSQAQFPDPPFVVLPMVRLMLPITVRPIRVQRPVRAPLPMLGFVDAVQPGV